MKPFTPEQHHQLHNAIVAALDDSTDLRHVAITLRAKQLMEETLHPDDSFPWAGYGSSYQMGRLADTLEELGILDEIESGARQIFAELRLARRTLDAIENLEGEWGGAIATAQSWRGAYDAKAEAQS